MPTHVQVTQSCRSRGRLARAKCSRTLAVSTLSRCSPLDFQYGCFSLRRQRKVGAAPHRGNANRPLTNQGKAKAPSTQTKSATQAKKSRQLPHPQKPQNRNPMQPDMLTNKPRGDPRTRNNNQITPPTIPKIQRMPRSDPRHSQRIRPIGQQMHDPSTSKPKRRGSINRMPKPMIGTHEQRDPPHTPMRQRTMRNPQPSRA